MDTFWKEALWQQYGAAIDALGLAVEACPAELWEARVWKDEVIPEYPAYWSVCHHVLIFLDLLLTGSVEGFQPPAPFGLFELDPEGAMPEQPHTKEEILFYVKYVREKCKARIASLTEEEAKGKASTLWVKRYSLSYYEMFLYNLRHVQEHIGQLNLFLGQHDLAVPGWVARTGD